MDTRTILCWTALTLLGSACSPAVNVNDPKEPDVEAAPPKAEGFPDGWSDWDRFNDEPVAREGTLLELHYNDKATGARSGAFPAGTVLVKAEHMKAGSSKGDLTKLSVMTKGSGDANGGWTFGVYSPDGQAQPFDKDGCALCHSQRAATDFVFSDRSAL